MRPFVPLLLVFLALPLAAQPLPRNEVALSAGGTDFNGRYDAATYGASYSRFWHDMFSTRLGVFGSEHDFRDERGGQKFRAIHADFGFHFRRNRLVSPHLSAGLVHASHEVTPYTNESDTTTTLIGSAGVDFNLRRNFALGVEASYIDFTPNPRDRFSSSLNPVTGLASARFRW